MNTTVKLLCINDDFDALSESFRGRKLPKLMENYTLINQEVENGEVLVELKEIPAMLFNMNKHFFVMYDSEIDKIFEV